MTAPTDTRLFARMLEAARTDPLGPVEAVELVTWSPDPVLEAMFAQDAPWTPEQVAYAAKVEARHG
jgi:hypothetical protein